MLGFENPMNISFMNKKKNCRIKTEIPKPSDLHVQAERVFFQCQYNAADPFAQDQGSSYIHPV